MSIRLVWYFVKLGIIVSSWGAFCMPVAYASKADDTLVYASDSEPKSVSPYHNSLREGIILSRLAWDTLIYRDPKTGKYEPDLATSWHWQDDTHLILMLRKDVTFQNGDPFTAQDVVFTFNYVVSPNSGIVTRQNVDWIDHVEKIDDYTVIIDLKAPFPEALEYLSGPVPIYPAKYFQKVGLAGYEQAPIGTGPYKITKIIKGQGVDLERNEQYFSGGPIKKPAIKKIKFEVIPDSDSRLALLMAGAVDWIWRVTPDQLDQIRMMPDLQVVHSESMRIGYLTMDITSPTMVNSPFRNKLVREAVNYAIDRDALIAYWMQGGSRPLYTPCYPEQFGCDTSAAKKYAYNPNKAKALMVEAGYPNGFTTELYAYRNIDLAGGILDDLRAIGIVAKLHYVSYSDLLEKQRAGQVPIAFQTWGSYSVNDISASTSVFFKGGVDDHSQDKTVIALLQKGDESVDPAERKANYRAAIKRITEQAYWAPLLTFTSHYAFTKDLNFTPYPDEIPRFVESSWK